MSDDPIPLFATCAKHELRGWLFACDNIDDYRVNIVFRHKGLIELEVSYTGDMLVTTLREQLSDFRDHLESRYQAHWSAETDDKPSLTISTRPMGTPSY